MARRHSLTINVGLGNSGGIVATQTSRPMLDKSEENAHVNVSVVIPCFNEADGIAYTCERLRAFQGAMSKADTVEFVFVDDGSTDGTSERIRQEANGLDFRLLRHAENCGLTAALQTGFESCSGEEIVTLDCDCTYDPLQLPGLLNVLREGNDLVTGSPYHPNGEVVGVIRWRLFLSRMLSRIYWLVLPVRLYTYTSCFRAYRKEILPSLEATDGRFLGVTQLLVSGMLAGMRVAEHPVRLTARRFGKSKISVMNVMLSHIFYIFELVLWRLQHRIRKQPRSFSTVVSGSSVR